MRPFFCGLTHLYIFGKKQIIQKFALKFFWLRKAVYLKTMDWDSEIRVQVARTQKKARVYNTFKKLILLRRVEFELQTKHTLNFSQVLQDSSSAKCTFEMRSDPSTLYPLYLRFWCRSEGKFTTYTKLQHQINSRRYSLINKRVDQVETKQSYTQMRIDKLLGGPDFAVCVCRGGGLGKQIRLRYFSYTD